RVCHTAGLAPEHFVHARRTQRRPFKKIYVTHHAHQHRAGMPPARAKPAENGLPSGFLIEMKGLRVELARELDNLFLRHMLVTELHRLADAEIFPVISRPAHAVSSPHLCCSRVSFLIWPR